MWTQYFTPVELWKLTPSQVELHWFSPTRISTGTIWQLQCNCNYLLARPVVLSKCKHFTAVLHNSWNACLGILWTTLDAQSNTSSTALCHHQTALDQGARLYTWLPNMPWPPYRRSLCTQQWRQDHDHLAKSIFHWHSCHVYGIPEPGRGMSYQFVRKRLDGHLCVTNCSPKNPKNTNPHRHRQRTSKQCHFVISNTCYAFLYKFVGRWCPKIIPQGLLHCPGFLAVIEPLRDSYAVTLGHSSLQGLQLPANARLCMTMQDNVWNVLECIWYGICCIGCSEDLKGIQCF